VAASISVRETIKTPTTNLAADKVPPPAKTVFPRDVGAPDSRPWPRGQHGVAGDSIAKTSRRHLWRTGANPKATPSPNTLSEPPVEMLLRLFVVPVRYVEIWKSCLRTMEHYKIMINFETLNCNALILWSIFHKKNAVVSKKVKCKNKTTETRTMMHLINIGTCEKLFCNQNFT
jgi:hypothetical protein